MCGLMVASIKLDVLDDSENHTFRTFLASAVREGTPQFPKRDDSPSKTRVH